MTATLPTDLLVVDVIEAKARRLMARRAALPDAYPHRARRAELRTEIEALIDRWLAVGRG